MTKQFILLLSLIALFLTACSQKPNPHPKNPNYKIEKPKVKYRPSKKNLKKMVKKLQGSPYVWAEEGPNAFDCSGFTYYMYGSMGIEIPRVSRHQAKQGKRVSVQELQYGDLIFFATNKKRPKRITHVGMYLGDGWFTHASTIKHEVVYSNLFTSSYYKKRLRVCRRYLPQTPKTTHPKQELWNTVASKQVPQSTSPQSSQHRTPTLPLERSATQTNEQGKAIVIQAPLNELEQSSPSGNFYVQVGSFEGKPKSSLIYQITRNGFRHKIIHFPTNGKEVSKLLIGPYKTHSDAEFVLEKVRKEIKHDAFIAEIR